MKTTKTMKGFLIRTGLMTVTGALLALPLATRAGVDPGWDLFATLPGTAFGGVPLSGIPLNTFNFTPYGTFATGNTDTIVQRLDTAIAGLDNSTPNSQTPWLTGPASMGGLGAFNSGGGTIARVSLQLVALQLQTTIQTTFGGLFPLGYYDETLQTAVPSFGLMDIHDADKTSGTFDSSLYVHFDLRAGQGQAGLTGPIVFSDALIFNGSGIWSRTADTGALVINSVNYLLLPTIDGTASDFWPANPLTEISYDPTPETPSLFGTHVVASAVPEASTYGFVGISLCAMLGLARSYRNRRSQSAVV